MSFDRWNPGHSEWWGNVVQCTTLAVIQLQEEGTAMRGPIYLAGLWICENCLFHFICKNQVIVVRQKWQFQEIMIDHRVKFSLYLKVNVGSYKINIASVIIGIEVGLIIFPINAIIVLLFKKSRPSIATMAHIREKTDWHADTGVIIKDVEYEFDLEEMRVCFTVYSLNSCYCYSSVSNICYISFRFRGLQRQIRYKIWYQPCCKHRPSHQKRGHCAGAPAWRCIGAHIDALWRCLTTPSVQDWHI